MDPRSKQVPIQSLLHFLREITALQTIERVILIRDRSRKESDAEHTWHLCMLYWVLEPHLPPQLDKVKMFKMLLVHDLPEIYAGDSPLFDEKKRIGKSAREKEAAEKLFQLLPPSQAREFHALFSEYEEKKTLESRHAQALDKLQPMIQNVEAGGGLWKHYNMTREMVIEKKRKLMEHDPILTEIFDTLLNEADKKGYLKK